MTQAAAPAPLPVPRVRLALMLGSLTAIGPLAIDMYLPALPTIARDLGATSSATQISLAIYFVGIAVGQAFYGPLSDRFGRKPALYAGLTLFLAASIGCAVAPTAGVLVACRLVQALGGCAPLVVPRAVVRDLFDERDSVRMLSMLILVMGLAPILAPLVGGQLLVRFGWRSVFWVLSGYATVALAMVTFLLPESHGRERRTREPLAAVIAVYGRLLRDRPYVGQVLVGGFIFAGLLTYITGSPFVLIEIFGVPPERFGLYFGTNAVGLIIASQVNRWLAGRAQPQRIVGAVLPVAMTAGLLLVAVAASGLFGLPGILVPLFCFVACHGFVMPNTTAMAMAPHGRVAGSASALLGTLQFVIGATAGALVGMFGNRTAVPFAAIIAGCGIAAFTVHRTVLAPGRS